MTTTFDNNLFLIGRVHEKSNQLLVTKMAGSELAGLAPSHGDVIANLLKHGEITMSELAGLVNRDPSTVTALVAKLKRLGHLRTRRDIADSRVTLVSLTARGEALRGPFMQITRDVQAAVFQGFSAGERAQLNALLTRMNSNL